MTVRLTLLACATWIGGLLGAAELGNLSESERANLSFFEQKIRPVLVTSCYSCHSVESGKSKGGLLLDTREALLKGGNSGPSIVPGKPEKSLLVRAIRGTEEDLEMPPKEKLPAQTVADFEEWIRQGAFDPRQAKAGALPNAIDWAAGRAFWAFVPPAKVAPPAITAPTAIDAFLQARRDEKGLPTAPPADKRTLIRRATFDLTGLPPTPAEVAAFENDASPDAYASLIERLLNSPAYGERWGRHWLDAARYADTAGDSSDYPVPDAWRYRNWVIEAFNRDMPYDQFIREQIAGDLLKHENDAQKYARITATGFIAQAKRFGVQPEKNMHLTYEDSIDTMGRAVLGMTISCARCHDHKFDPVSQEDYYALYGFFSSTQYPFAGAETDQRPRDYVPLLTEAEIAATVTPVTARMKTIDKELEALDKRKKELERLPADKISSEERKKQLAENRKQTDALKKEQNDVYAKGYGYPKAYAVREGKGEDAHVQKRGEPGAHNRVKQVRRRFLTILGGAELPKEHTGSGRDFLAEQLVSKSNPLTARVMVNRIWHHHFGQGLVQTPNDFGKQGKRPTHPELLDYLAHRFMDNGWSVKAMHREIMLSAAYRAASAENPVGLEKDPGNEYLWRYPRRRLDAEQLRDAMLAVSGALDPARGEGHPFPPVMQWRFTQHAQFFGVYETQKRSIYLMTQRQRRHPYLALFDGADNSTSVGARSFSTTPLQSLFLMNDPFMHQTADAFAKRLMAASPSARERAETAARLAYGRPLADAEWPLVERFLKDAEARARTTQASAELTEPLVWSAFARTVLAGNEFAFLD